MDLSQVLQEIQAQAITLSLSGEKLRYQAPGPVPAAVVDLIREHKPALIRHLKTDVPTLEDFRARGCYPAVRGGELLLVTATGEPATAPAILAAWEAAKGEIQAQLEDRYRVLTAWAEALLAEHGRAYLTSPDDVTCKTTTAERVDDPLELAAELLRCEAGGLYYEVMTKGGKMHAPTSDHHESEIAA